MTEIQSTETGVLAHELLKQDGHERALTILSVLKSVEIQDTFLTHNLPEMMEIRSLEMDVQAIACQLK